MSIILEDRENQVEHNRFTVNFSKPHMQRALVIALLSKETITIHNPSSSSEIEALLQACVQLGLKIVSQNEQALVVRGVDKSIEAPSDPINIRVSGALLRILIAIVFFKPSLKLTLCGNPSLKGRPMDCFLAELSQNGLYYEFQHSDENFVLYLENRVSNYKPIYINSNQTSQFITALMLAAPLAEQDIVINLITHKIVSKTYINLTTEMMAYAGVSIEENNTGYVVNRGQYIVENILIPSDFTSASYLVGLSLTLQEPLILENYFPSTFTAEHLFYEAAKQMGLNIVHDENTMSLHIVPLSSEQTSLIIDAKDMPTVVPTLTAMAPFFQGKVTIYNAAHVENHKTKRISIIMSELEKVGIHYHVLYTAEGSVDGFITFGKQTPQHSKTLDPKGDHRNYMSLFIATINSTEKINVIGEKLVHASFPNFMQQISKLNIKSTANI